MNVRYFNICTMQDISRRYIVQKEYESPEPANRLAGEPENG